MKLTMKLKFSLDKKTYDVLREIQLYSAKFSNMVNYDFRQGNFMSFYDMYNYYKNHIRFKYLQAYTYENVLKQFSKDYKSYKALKEKHGKEPKKWNKPGFPRYKNENNSIDAIFAKTAIRIKDGKLLFSIGKAMKKEKQIKSLEIILPEKASNLAAITFMNKPDKYLIDRNVLKSKIATYNKWLKEAYSKEMKTTGSKYFKGTKKIKKKYEDRNNYIHQASRPIIKQAEEKDVKEIVIGDFRTIKTGNKNK